jgi:hypothetical protein
LYFNGAITNGDKNPSLANNKNKNILAESVIYNCSAFVETESNGAKVVKGNVTEVGLIKYLMASSIEVESLIANKQKDGFILF